ncbi:hypothetical protein BCR43DRAFT_523710 [Syncephalastrum racemosum]|uniref:RRM domain-containing protein n=1 Tax=Syncephalastrum racemosum TaxID=13706 RepID=A0A1X2HF28_SYNRA|nr:hypothetical protein BCR43DRAFT_523710 [Syncephalastrum racemosum]
MDNKKLTKREQKAAAFRDRKKKKPSLDEEKAVPEQDVVDQPDAQNESGDSSFKQAQKKRKADQDGDGQQKKRKRGTRGVKARERQQQQKSRYILFVGNLAKDVGKEDLSKFLAEQVDGEVEVRLGTVKGTNESKGYAFAEFKNNDCFMKCLQLDGQKFASRKLNIQLTAGGGGKTAARTEKIKERNDTLKSKLLKSSKNSRGGAEEGYEE